MATFISLFTLNSTAFASIPDNPQPSDTASWSSKSNITYGGKSFIDSDPNDENYRFEYKDGDSILSCISTLTFSSSPYAEGGGGSAQQKITSRQTGICRNQAEGSLAITNASIVNGGTTPQEGGEAGPEAVCITENGLGWIICPLTDLLSETTKLVADQVEKMLRVDPLPLNPGAATDGTAAVYQVWSGVRNIANIVLVFGFFAIIFSQATSIGISSYGIKKLLPRLVIVSIGINLSYFICALLIDIFNVIGAGVAGFFSAANVALPTPNGADSTSSLGALVFSALAAFTAAGAVFVAGWAIILPALAIAATGFLTAFAVLVFREVAIVILIILSPLAFAAWLLPNTDSWFGKWRGLFTNLLLMYPLVMVIIYGSIITSNIIKITADPNPSIIDSLVTNVMALMVLAVPLFSLPFLLKFAGGIGQRIGAFTNNPNRGLVDRARKKRDEVKGRNYYQRNRAARKAEREEGRTRKFAQDMSANTDAGKRRRRAYGGLRITDAQKEASKEAQANIYDAYLNNLSKTTERRRVRATDAGAFTAGSKYAVKDANGNLEAVDKDKFMSEVYVNGKVGQVETLDGTKTEFDGSDRFTRSAIAAQAAKSGDKAMYGKLLTAAHQLQNEPAYRKDEAGNDLIGSDGNKIIDSVATEARVARGKELEFTLRDQGVSNPSGVIGGHPDIIKGKYSAFKAVSVDSLSQMDGSTVKRMHEYLSNDEMIADDLRLGTRQGVTEEVMADASNRGKSQQEINEIIDIKTDAKLKKRVSDYKTNATTALTQAVEMINNNPNLEGKVPANGDLAKALKDTFGAIPGDSENTKPEYTIAYKSRSERSAELAGSAGVPVQGPPVTITAPAAATGGREFVQPADGGLIVPHITPTPQPSSTQPTPQPTPTPHPTAPTPPPFTVRQTPSTGQPSPTDTTIPPIQPQPPVQPPPRRRDDGGNFGGFA